MCTWRIHSVHEDLWSPGHPLPSATEGECVSESMKALPRNSMATVTPIKLHSSSFLRHRGDACHLTLFCAWPQCVAE